MSRISRIWGRIKRQIHLVVMGHIVNWPWRQKLERRRVRYEVTQKSSLIYLSRYKDFIRNIKINNQSGSPEPDRVFSIWLQGKKNAPDIVKACFRSMRRNLSQEMVIIDETNLFDWIQLPAYIIEKWKKGKMSHAHFCDVCRVELLYRHGGVWLDATDYVTAPIPAWIMNEGFFIYMAGSRIRGAYSFVQNCFFRAKKGNELLGIWREAILNYWKEENSVISYFVHHLLFKMAVENNSEAVKLFARMPKHDQDPTHNAWYLHKAEPYDEKFFLEYTAGAFFQKTDYKCRESMSPPPGSIAETMINM